MAEQPVAPAPLDFSTHVLSLASTALIALGKMPAPDGNTQPVDLETAHHLIDVLAMLETKTKGNLDEAVEHVAGQVFVQLDYADLAGWRSWVDYPVALAQGRGALRVWGDLADGKGKLTADLALDEVPVRLGKKLPELDLETLRGRLEGSYKTGAWTLAGRKLELQAAGGMRIVPTDFQVAWQQEARSGRVTGSASASIVDLAMLRRLAAYLPLDARSRELLDRHQPRGRLAELRAGSGQAGEVLDQYSLRAAFTDLGLLAGGYFPGANGLAGQVELDDKGGSLSVDAGRSGISLPAVFVEPDIAFDQLRGRATWKVAGRTVDVKLERLQFRGWKGIPSTRATIQPCRLCGAALGLSVRI